MKNLTMKRYAIPYTNQMLITEGKKPDGYVRLFEDKERPTIDHICSPDGVWVLKKKTRESVEEARRKRYAAETDELKKHIESDIMLLKDASITDPKLEEWRRKVNQIKDDLPYPEPDGVNEYYKPVITSGD